MRKMFSKNQIQEMIQSGVSSGATKLYRHDISMNDQVVYVIINNSPVSLTGESLINTLANTGYVSLKMINGLGYEIPILDFDDSEDFVIYYLESGSITSSIIDDEEIEDDEVHPL